MTIYGAGYRVLDYRSTSMPARLWPIVAHTYRSMFRRRLGILLFVLCFGPALFNLAVMMLQMGVMTVGASQEHMARLRGMNPRMDCASIEFFLTPISEYPSFFVLVVLTAVVTCRAIAVDRETRGLEIYWTRCIEPYGYFFAKWLGSFLLIGTLTVAAPLVIWLLAALIAPDWSYLEATSGFVPRVLAALAVFTAVLTGLATMLSAIASTANLATILWFGLLAGSAAVVRVLDKAFPNTWSLVAISPWDADRRLAQWLAGHAPRNDYPVAWALVSLGVIGGLLAAVALRRMRRVEAIT